MRQHIMEATDGKSDFFLTNPNVDKMLAFGFEYPMSGRKCAQFCDDGSGEIKADIRKYIEIIYSHTPVTNYNVALNWNTVGIATRFSLLMEPNNRFLIATKRKFEIGLRKYYENSGVLICRPSSQGSLASSFKLLGGSLEKDGSHNHDGN